MPSCAVITCRKRSQMYSVAREGISFHQFPTDPGIKNLWIEATGRIDWIPTKWSSICSQHFDDDDYIATKSGKRNLIYGACPSRCIVMCCSSAGQVDSDPDAEDTAGTWSGQTSVAPVDSDTNAEDMPGMWTGMTNQDFSSGNEIKVFCPNCNTEVSHTAAEIREEQTKLLVAKVYHYFEQEYEELKKIYADLDLTPLSKFRQRTALATGVSETVLQEILKEEEERNAEKRREPPKKRRAARKRRRQTDSSSGEGSSDDNEEEIEQPSYAEEVQTLVVKMEPPEYTTEEPEIFIPTEVKLEPSDGEIGKEDPISVDVKAEPRDDALDTANETLALNEPAASKRRKRKISKRTDDTSTLQHTPGEYSAPVASSSVTLAETLTESGLPGEREIKMEEIEILEEGFS